MSLIGNISRDEPMLYLRLGNFNRQAAHTNSLSYDFSIPNESYYYTNGTNSFCYTNNKKYEQKIQCDIETASSNEIEINIVNEDGNYYENIPEHFIVLELEYLPEY